MKKLSTYNQLTKIAFLMLTPVLFRALNFAFVWHSIYWGAITWVFLIWGGFVVLSPLFGRIGCGWLCFFGTWQDFSGQQALFKTRWHKPLWWTRLFVVVAFFATSLTFFFVNIHSGMISHVQFDPGFLNMDFSSHYKHVWLYDSIGAVLFGLLLDRRWMCRNLCFMGAICAAGAKHSRLIPVVDSDKCNFCGKCDRDCLVKIPITEYAANNDGLVTDSECILCGKCIDSCYSKAVSIKFVWNRKRYGTNLVPAQPAACRAANQFQNV